MYPVPLTYFFNFSMFSSQARPWVLAEIAAAGAKHLVLSGPLVDAILQNPAEMTVLEKEMVNAGLDFVDCHSQIGLEVDLNVQNRALRRAVIARHKLIMEIANYFHVDTITIHTGNNWTKEWGALPAQQHMDMIADSLEHLLPLAEELNMTVCIENVWSQTATPERLMEMKKRFPTDALGFCYDAGHANIAEQGHQYPDGDLFEAWQYTTPDTPPNEKQILEKMLPQVVNCHIHDNNGDRDRHWLPGKGSINWPHIRTLLMQAPRLKCIQSEVSVTPNQIPLKQLIGKFEELFPECKNI